MSDYRDYVIKNGKFVGKFDEMYRESSETPWHQDETAYGIFTELDMTILSYFHRIHHFSSVLEVGCGLGYVSFRLNEELSRFGPARITGFDISETAIQKARDLFPGLSFHAKDILTSDLTEFNGMFDLVIGKEILWYVLQGLDVYFDNLALLSKKYVYISQSFPEQKVFLGSDMFPNAQALEAFVADRFTVIYSVVEKDSRYHGRELAHILCERK